MIVTQTTSLKIQADGGSNSHIFNERKHFWRLQETKAMVKGVFGKRNESIGLGIVLVRINEMVIPLLSILFHAR